MTYDDYRYELPDFILGKSSPDVARAIERLIETDSAFRAEFLEMKSLIEGVTPSLNRAFEHAPDAPTPAYFEALSKKILARAMPKKATWWQVFKSDLKLLIETARSQWVGGLVGMALALLLIIVTSELNNNTRQSTLANSNEQNNQQSLSLLVINGFALGLTPEFFVTQMETYEAEEVLNILESKLPIIQQPYKILTEDEVEALFKPM